MTRIRRYKQLYNATAAGVGNWIRLDQRYEDHQDARAIKVSLVAGDTFTLEAIVKDVRGDISDSFLATLKPEEIVTLKIYTATEADTIAGGWTFIRVTKIGTAGLGLVEGFI